MDHLSSSLQRLAVLIDAENVGAAFWPAASATAARFGTIVMARAYVCHAPTPGWFDAAGVEIIDGRPADGANAADFLMAMDAAVIAAERQVDGIVLVTADDGFAAVAHGLRMRGMSVYALIPFNGGAVGRRLLAMADLAILVPMPVLKPPGPTPQENSWHDHFYRALQRCHADAEGWVELSVLGGELNATREKLPTGKLSDLARKVSDIEWLATPTTFRVRKKNRVPPADAAQEAAPFAAADTPRDCFHADDEIPF